MRQRQRVQQQQQQQDARNPPLATCRPIWAGTEVRPNRASRRRGPNWAIGEGRGRGVRRAVRVWVMSIQGKQSFAHVAARWVGTGHPDMTRHEWVTQQHRDSVCSYLGHGGMPMYFAVAQGNSVGRTRYELLERMLQPCGPPPVKPLAAAMMRMQEEEEEGQEQARGEAEEAGEGSGEQPAEVEAPEEEAEGEKEEDEDGEEEEEEEDGEGRTRRSSRRR